MSHKRNNYNFNNNNFIIASVYAVQKKLSIMINYKCKIMHNFRSKYVYVWWYGLKGMYMNLYSYDFVCVYLCKNTWVHRCESVYLS